MNDNDDTSVNEPSMDGGIPKAWQGKNTLELIQILKEKEQHIGHQANELGELRTNREQSQAQLQQLQNQMNMLAGQVQNTQTQPQQQVPQADPFDNFNERFEQDPGGALRGVLDTYNQQVTQNVQKVVNSVSSAGASEYYNEQKSDNPDFDRREPQMAQLLNQYADLFGDKVNSKQAFELVNLASQGLNRSYYEQQAAEKVKKEKVSTENEKESAQLETSHGSGTGDGINMLEAFKSAKTTAEMEQMVGYKDD